MTLNDYELDRMLSAWKPAPPRAGFADNLASTALAYPQQRGIFFILRQQLIDICRDLFGVSQDTVPLRLAGAMAIVIIGFTSGYMSESPFALQDDEDVAAVVEIDEDGLAESI